MTITASPSGSSTIRTTTRPRPPTGRGSRSGRRARRERCQRRYDRRRSRRAPNPLLAPTVPPTATAAAPADARPQISGGAQHSGVIGHRDASNRCEAQTGVGAPAQASQVSPPDPVSGRSPTRTAMSWRLVSGRLMRGFPCPSPAWLLTLLGTT
jgi:hypothetical protein